MSYVDTAYQGLHALSQRNWDEAITKLSKALASSANPAWLIARSRALVGAGRFRDALEDADLAWHEASRRGSKRDLIVEAQHRRAVAYNRLGELANADCCCVYVLRMLDGGRAAAAEDPGDALTGEGGVWRATLADAKREAEEMEARERGGEGGQKLPGLGGLPKDEAKTKTARLTQALRFQILQKMDQLPADDPARKRTATQKPPVRQLNSADAPAQSKSTGGASSATPTAAASAAPQQPKNEKLRLQDFQTTTTMSVSIFSKGVDKTRLNVQFNPFEVILDPIVYPDGEEKRFTLATWGEILPSECKYTVTPSKVELQLKKKIQGRWASLESQDGAERTGEKLESTSSATSQAQNTAAAAPQDAPQPSKSEEKPGGETHPPTAKPAPTSYPTSSRTGPKDWDKLDVDSDEEESDVNSFFKKLYKNATPEQQRAMMKSFTESSGTSLSTDWNDVKGRTVEAVPPEGVEAKKWD